MLTATGRRGQPGIVLAMRAAAAMRFLQASPPEPLVLSFHLGLRPTDAHAEGQYR